MKLPIKTKTDSLVITEFLILKMEKISMQISFLYEKYVMQDEFNQMNSNIRSEIDKCKQEEHKVL